MTLPACFREKIEIDKRIQDFVNRPVIQIKDHAALKILTDRRDAVRMACEAHHRPSKDTNA